MALSFGPPMNSPSSSLSYPTMTTATSDFAASATDAARSSAGAVLTSTWPSAATSPASGVTTVGDITSLDPPSPRLRTSAKRPNTQRRASAPGSSGSSGAPSMDSLRRSTADFRADSSERPRCSSHASTSIGSTGIAPTPKRSIVERVRATAASTNSTPRLPSATAATTGACRIIL
ncbi:unannotated protein [freshwater metagenome]|uniref:Unannotated protein n=1 Tax=freshwater metagenome TaxID=449393 RepID=A0A6J6XHM1_9ZZZZ